MTTSVTVTWIKSIVEIAGQTMYRVQSTCSAPVGITDAALFIYSSTDASYLQVATIGDVLSYWPANPPTRQLAFTAATNVVSGDIGDDVTGSPSGDTGMLLGFSPDKTVWYVAPDTSADVFDVEDVVTIDPSGHTGTVLTSIGQSKYRSVTVTLDFSTPQLAAEAITLQETRLQNLITDWDNGYGSFAGTTTESIHAP